MPSERCVASHGLMEGVAVVGLGDRIVGGQLAVGEAASQCSGVADLHARVTQVAAAAVDALSAAFWSWERDGGDACLTFDDGHLPPNARTLAAALAADGSPLSAADRVVLAAEDAIAVVWSAAGCRVGLVCAYGSRAQGGFSADDALVLQAIGNAAGNVAQREEMVDRLRVATQRLDRVEGRLSQVLEISQTLNSTRDPEELLNALTAGAMELLHCSSGFAGLHRPEGMVTKTLLRHEGAREFEYCWRPGDGVPGRCLVTKRVYLTNDLVTNPFGDSMLRSLGASNVACAPIVIADEVLGFFALVGKPDGFAPGDRQVVEGLASHAALALENAIAGQRLGELEQFKSDFLNLAAHELRGPVAIARGYLEMLGEDIDRWRPSQRESMLRVTRNKLDQIRYLVDRMLETARLEERKPDLQLDTVDLRQLLGEATAATAYAVKPEHRFAVDTCDRPVLVRVDRRRMRGAIANLLENACKYSPDGGPIQARLRVVGTERWAEIEVEDHGLGIDERDLPRLFSQFGRILTKKNGHIPGTGLGLYLSRQLVLMHGGDITVESRSGIGSRFLLRLPLAPDAGTIPAGS